MLSVFDSDGLLGPMSPYGPGFEKLGSRCPVTTGAEYGCCLFSGYLVPAEGLGL